MEGSGCRRAGEAVVWGEVHRLEINHSLRSVSVFVVWFLWNNLIKVAGWLNSERKLGYICLSFPLKSFSHPAMLLPEVTAVFIIFPLFERREKVRKLPLSHYFHNYFSGCQKIRPNHNQKREKCYCLIGFWSGSASSLFKRQLKDLISFTAAFKGLFHLQDFLT